MNSQELIKEMDYDNLQELEAEEDPNIKKKPYRLNVSMIHCYKLTEGPK